MERTPIQNFGPNEKGRDFVIGDLHGAWDCFESLLGGIAFNPEVDRMFSVGDLVDRGIDSMRCLYLLNEPWFHAVFANHEEMMYEKFNGGWSGVWWFNNGGNWGMEKYNSFQAIKSFAAGNIDHRPILSMEDLDFIDLLEKVEQLPHLITISHKSGKKFHIIHAEFPPGHELTDAILSSPQKVMEFAETLTDDDNSSPFLQWGRTKFEHFTWNPLTNRKRFLRGTKRLGLLSQFNDDLSHIISGHTQVMRPVTLQGQTNIDTGAYHTWKQPERKWAGLTCLCLDDWKFYKARPDSFEQIEPFVINKVDLEEDLHDKENNVAGS